MPHRLQTDLSKRERQVMAIVYSRKSASVGEVLRDLRNPPSYSAVRSIVNILEAKGFLKHRKEGKKYVYFATIPPRAAMMAAVQHLVKTYFDNSVAKTVTAILESRNDAVTEEELDRLAELIERIRGVDKRCYDGSTYTG